MRRVSLFLLVLALAAPAALWAQGKPDFSGTWTLDPAKSDPPPQRGGGGGGGGGRGFGGGPQTIKQTATELTVTTEGRGGQQTMTYKLDGSESVNKVMGRGGEIEARSKAHWDGSKLVIETTRDMGGNMVTTTETRSLSADQKEMTVEVSFGENKRKIVYTKGS
jgi:hypothetical protein